MSEVRPLVPSASDVVERPIRELMALFDLWALHYRPEMFGLSDRIAGPPLSQAECRLIREALSLSQAKEKTGD